MIITFKFVIFIKHESRKCLLGNAWVSEGTSLQVPFNIAVTLLLAGTPIRIGTPLSILRLRKWTLYIGYNEEN